MGSALENLKKLASLPGKAELGLSKFELARSVYPFAREFFARPDLPTNGFNIGETLYPAPGQSPGLKSAETSITRITARFFRVIDNSAIPFSYPHDYVDLVVDFAGQNGNPKRRRISLGVYDSDQGTEGVSEGEARTILAQTASVLDNVWQTRKTERPEGRELARAFARAVNLISPQVSDDLSENGYFSAIIDLPKNHFVPKMRLTIAGTHGTEFEPEYQAELVIHSLVGKPEFWSAIFDITTGGWDWIYDFVGITPKNVSDLQTMLLDIGVGESSSPIDTTAMFNVMDRVTAALKTVKPENIMVNPEVPRATTSEVFGVHGGMIVYPKEKR